MPSRATLRKGERRTFLEFAGSAQDEPSLTKVRDTLHDRLFADAARTRAQRAGPVVWHTFAASAAPDMLAKAGLIDKPNAQGLILWLATNPGTVLIVGTLDVVVPRQRPARRVQA